MRAYDQAGPVGTDFFQHKRAPVLQNERFPGFNGNHRKTEFDEALRLVQGGRNDPSHLHILKFRNRFGFAYLVSHYLFDQSIAKKPTPISAQLDHPLPSPGNGCIDGNCPGSANIENKDDRQDRFWNLGPGFSQTTLLEIKIRPMKSEQRYQDGQINQDANAPLICQLLHPTIPEKDEDER